MTAEPGRGCIQLPRVMHGTHVLTYVASALREWHHLGADVLWHTAWRSPYTDDLENVLRLSRMEAFASEEEFLRPESDACWWKLCAVQRWLREAADDVLPVWIDDEIGEHCRAKHLADPRLVVVAPEPKTGLTPEQISQITQVLRSRS
mgnify:FL=1